MMATSVAIFAQLPGVNPNEKVMSDAKKEAKRLAKEGWRVMIGDVDMVSQLDLAMKAAYVLMEGPDGTPTARYILASSIGASPLESAARKKSRALCEAQLINSLSTHVEGMVDHIMQNRQLSDGAAETKEEMKAQIMSNAKQSLSMVKPVMTLMRKNGKDFEVMTQLAYDLEKLK